VRLDAHVDYLTDILPALLLFGLGLSITVAPLTATVLADADEHNAGIASGVNNAIARIAGLVAIAGVGAIIAAHYGSRLESELGPIAHRPEVAPAVEAARREPLASVTPRGVPPAVRVRIRRATEDASVSAFRLGMGISAGLVGLGGALGVAGIRNPRRRVKGEHCPGGQFVGHPREAATAA
jgi:hypothetical protein